MNSIKTKKIKTSKGNVDINSNLFPNDLLREQKSFSSYQEIDSLKQFIHKAFLDFNTKSHTLTKAYQELKKEIVRINLELENKNKELTEKNIALDQTKDFLDNVFQSMTDGILVVDKENKIIKINKSFLYIFKVNENRIINKKINEYKKLDEIRKIIDVYKNNPSKCFFTGLKVKIEKEELVLELSITKTQSGDFLVNIKNLTEVKDLRRQLVQNASLANLGQMAVTVAHEIRNPLGGIEGFASLLKRDLKGNDKNIKLVEKIITGVRSLNSFITSLLSFSKTIKVHLMEVKLKNVIDKAILYSGQDNTEKYKKIKITKKIPKNISLNSDPELIFQILLNLIINSLQVIGEYKKGKIEIIVNIVKKLEKQHKHLKTFKSMHYNPSISYVRISVGDSGPGIESDIIEKIFTPFYTTKSFGTGIGLSMVHKIIEVLEGKIQIEPKTKNGGAKFYIYLPYKNNILD